MLTKAPPAAAAPVVVQKPESPEDLKALREAIAQLRGSVRTLSEAVAAIGAKTDATGKGTQTQLAKLNEAIERVERSQGDPQARLAKIAEAVERLDRRTAASQTPAAPAPDTTGSVRTAPAADPRAPAADPRSPAAKARLDGYVLLGVERGVAIVDSRFGAIEVEVGDEIRGAGRVQEIKRQDGRWVVVTSRGIISTVR